ncbi:Uncharacterized protein DAT39_017114, partial [Clarias magur]
DTGFSYSVQHCPVRLALISQATGGSAAPNPFTMVKAVRMSTAVLITAIKGDLITLSICLRVMVRDKRNVKQQKVGENTKGMLKEKNVELIMLQKCAIGRDGEGNFEIAAINTAAATLPS